MTHPDQPPPSDAPPPDFTKAPPQAPQQDYGVSQSHPQQDYGMSQPYPQQSYGGPPAPPPPPGYGAPAPYGYGGLQFPPGVELASKGRRVGAYFLSLLLVIVTLVIGYVIWGLFLWAKGTSPALRVLGMRCVDANTGQPVGFARMMLRDIVGGIVQSIVGWITALVSFILFLSTEKRQSLPDMIGSTVVVSDPNKVMG